MKGALQSGRPKGDFDLASRNSLKEEAYRSIKEALLSSDSSTEGFSERQLAATLNIGLGSVRSALERLRAEGLIVVAPNLGIRLPEITSNAIIDFYEMRIVLEQHVLQGLAKRAANDIFADIDDIIAQQERCVQICDTAAYHALDMEFHLGLAKLYGNSEILRALEGLRDRMKRLSTRLHAGHPERLPENFEQHKQILEAVKQGDGELAKQRLMTHLTHARNFILDPNARTL